MKRLNNGALKNTAVFFIAGLLFFSCALSGIEDYGTLVVMLPGGGSDAAARAAISAGFASTLSYRLDCSGPGEAIAERFNAGGRAAVFLSPGDWTVTVSAVNAADETIGSSSAVAIIMAGETTSVQMPVAIDTSRKDITSFVITSPVSAEGKVSLDGTTIKVYVPVGTDKTSMDFTLIHTGVFINSTPGTALDFSSDRTFMITAEDKSTKAYTVKVVGITWPSTWADYDLSGLAQPLGTQVANVEEDDTIGGIVQYDLSVTLNNIDNATYESLLSAITTKLGNPISGSQNFDGIRMDKFQKTSLYMIRVRLDMNLRNDEIVIRADRRLLSAVFPPTWW
jgi:hypothetical protein